MSEVRSPDGGAGVTEGNGLGIAIDRPGRVWSLRSEWSRAFTIMLALLLVTSVAAVAGMVVLVGEVRGTAHQLSRESNVAATLRTDLVTHEETGHKLLSDETVNRPAFVRQQHAITLEFEQAIAVYPTTEKMKASVIAAQRSWQAGLTQYGLWGPQVATLHGNHEVDNPLFGAQSDSVDAMVDGLEAPALLVLDRNLAHDGELERILLAVFVGLFGVAFAVTVHFRRRMGRDLLRPLARMHQGVSRLQSGDLSHRIEVGRRDELGELTEALNGMAGAVYDSHLALTLRATHDALTGLPNRTSLAERLDSSFDRGVDRRARQESVLYVDVDDFKEVNDALGHEGGDVLLVEVAARLKSCVRPEDLVARLGGDEFAIVVVEDEDGTTASEVADRILRALRAPFVVGTAQLSVSVSIGVAQRRPEDGDPAELLRRADFAMYVAKGSGKGQFQVFDAQVHDTVIHRSALRTDLASAVSSDQLRLHYQPVADLDNGEIIGLEALVRWEHPTLGLLAPGDFIPLAEATGEIDAIGSWVLETATAQVATWRRTMPYCRNLWVAVNLSPLQLGNPQSIAAIEDLLSDPACQADKLVLEVTESTLIADVEGAIEALNSLKRFGVRIAIDDFGCGFSSLSTLARLPVDILKIDRSFVSDETLGPASVPLLEGILGLADKLSLSVIAEGIEEPSQLDLLRRLGCSKGQGYLLGRPVPAVEFEAALASGGLLNLVQGAS